MIVVVIIGILAAVAIPSYQGFQEKARSSEAKVQLSAIYTAEKAFFAEHDRYTWNITDLGIPASPTKHYEAIGFSAFFDSNNGGTAIVTDLTTGAVEYGVINISMSYVACQPGNSPDRTGKDFDLFRACALKTNTTLYKPEEDWNIDHNRNIQQELSNTVF